MRRLALNLFAWAVIAIVAFPLFWMVVTSVKPQAELFQRPPSLLPHAPTLEHYLALLTKTHFLDYFRNSVVLAVSTTALVVTVRAR